MTYIPVLVEVDFSCSAQGNIKGMVTRVLGTITHGEVGHLQNKQILCYITVRLTGDLVGYGLKGFRFRGCHVRGLVMG